eukprot:1480283-Pleurochrysis_carterae.AAC.1
MPCPSSPYERTASTYCRSPWSLPRRFGFAGTPDRQAAVCAGEGDGIQGARAVSALPQHAWAGDQGLLGSR